jgi:xanthine dehydrogenase YagT iron-sulfur-binding subunit
MRELSEFRGSPVVLLFRDTTWNPAEREIVESYNRLIARLPTSSEANAQLVQVAADGDDGSPWRRFTFDDDSLALPVVAANDALAARLGVVSTPAVVVLDADGDVRWRHTGAREPDTIDLARAIAEASTPPVGATGSFSRRQFVAAVFGIAYALTVAPQITFAEQVTGSLDSLGGEEPTRRIVLSVNGIDTPLAVEPRVTLLDALREYAGLTGTKKGCDHGQCGACTVHIDGRRTLSCLTFAVMHEGRKITTIEGLAKGEVLHPMQRAFIEHDGFQCGYCTSGQIMSATAVLGEPWGARDDDVREAMSGNICRCGAYPGIVAAIQDVRTRAGGAR